MPVKKSISIVILSETGSPSRKCLTSASVLGKVFILHPPGTGELESPRGESIVADNIPAALNRVSQNCGTGFIVVISDDVALDDSLSRILDSLPQEAALAYGDSTEISAEAAQIKRTYEGPEDITERAELGPAVIYRTKKLLQAGGWDERLKYGFDYHLRLRLAEIGGIHHLPEIICRTVSHGDEPDTSAADKLYFPGRGKYGGFSYLFMEPEEEREIEGIFTGCLKRRGAYLEGEAPPMKPEPSIAPMVTVITPVYNREKYIGEAIESALRGKFTDFEHIVVDNGSTDRTLEEIERCARLDRRVKPVRCRENRIAKSLNLGLLYARGKYVAQLDSDDLYTQDTLQSMVDFMEETDCALGISYYSLIDADGNDLPEFGVIKHLEYSRNNILRVDGAGAVRVWRRSAMLELGGFDQGELCDYGEDYDLVLKVGEKWRVSRCHEVLYKYRRHPDNSDILRDPLFKLHSKNLARQRALERRRKMGFGD